MRTPLSASTGLGPRIPYCTRPALIWAQSSLYPNSPRAPTCARPPPTWARPHIPGPTTPIPTHPRAPTWPGPPIPYLARPLGPLGPPGPPRPARRADGGGRAVGGAPAAGPYLRGALLHRPGAFSTLSCPARALASWGSYLMRACPGVLAALRAPQGLCRLLVTNANSPTPSTLGARSLARSQGARSDPPHPGLCRPGGATFPWL